MSGAAALPSLRWIERPLARFLLLAGLSLAVNLALLGCVTGFGRLEAESDEVEYFDLAAALARGEPFEGLRRTPGWPWLLSLLIRLCGPSIVAAKVATCVLGALVPPLVDRLATRLLGSTAGGIAAFACALSPTIAWEHATLYSETASTVAFLLLQLLLLRAIVRETEPAATLRERCGAWLLFGAAAAAANLIKPAFVPWIAMLPLAGGIAWRRSPRRWLRAVACSACAFAVVLAPWWVRNWRASEGRFVAFSLAGDLSLAECNNPVIAAMEPTQRRVGDRIVVTGAGRFLDRLPASGLELAEARSASDDEATPRLAWQCERARIARERAIRWIVTEPRAFLRLALAKLGYGFSVHGCFDEGRAKSVAALLFVATWVVGLFGWGRLSRARPYGPLLLLQPISFIATTLLFFGSWRYRHPFEPAFVIAAVAGAQALRDAWRRRSLGSG